jgi:hypothetical protein
MKDVWIAFLTGLLGQKKVKSLTSRTNPYPGKVPPKAAPYLPIKRAVEEKSEPPSIDATYKRFLASPGSRNKPRRRRKHFFD